MDRYGLIGYPLGHSFSVSYFNQKFADENINAKYENFEIPSIDMLPEIIDSHPDLRGLNSCFLRRCLVVRLPCNGLRHALPMSGRC